jgi:hypothetical protein
MFEFTNMMLCEATMDEATIYGIKHNIKVALVKYNDDDTKYRIYIKSMQDYSLNGYVQYETHSDAIMTYQAIKDMDAAIEYMSRHLRTFESFDWKVIHNEEVNAIKAAKEQEEADAVAAEETPEDDFGSDDFGGGGGGIGGGDFGGEDLGGEDLGGEDLGGGEGGEDLGADEVGAEEGADVEENEPDFDFDFEL